MTSDTLLDILINEKLPDDVRAKLEAHVEAIDAAVYDAWTTLRERGDLVEKYIPADHRIGLDYQKPSRPVGALWPRD